MSARLVGEAKSKERFLFAFDVTEKTPRSPRSKLPFPIGFVYAKHDGQEERYYNQFLDSILAHSPYWRTPTTEFTPEEIERIVNLPPMHGEDEPLTSEELEWNRKQFPH